jgi:hypothetical protein
VQRFRFGWNSCSRCYKSDVVGGSNARWALKQSGSRVTHTARARDGTRKADESCVAMHQRDGERGCCFRLERHTSHVINNASHVTSSNVIFGKISSSPPKPDGSAFTTNFAKAIATTYGKLAGKNHHQSPLPITNCLHSKTKNAQNSRWQSWRPQ